MDNMGTTTEQFGPGIPVNGAAVRRLRLLHRHLGVTELAREMGITSNYVHKIESGKRPTVSPAMFARLKTALQADTEALLSRPELLNS